MKRLLRLILLISMAIPIHSSAQTDKSLRAPMGYELYSWKETRGTWSFSLLSNTSSEKTVNEIFSSKARLRGPDELKRSISALPRGATVFWLDRVPSGSGPTQKGSERLCYPPHALREEIQSYARDKDIKVEILPSGKAQKN
jgi:hypothetical protein